MRLGSAERQQVDFIPTGSIALDLALGVGGIPRGRITEIFGPESSGKTTLCQHVIAEAQRRGGVAAFIDVEHALDPGYARACGVNVDELLVSQPDTGEQALEITETLIRSGGIDVVVVDSVAALVPRAEIEGEMGDSLRRHPGPPHEPGPAQAHRRRQPLEHLARLHEPAAREDRGHVRQPGDRRRAAAPSSSTPRVRLDIRRVETIKTGTESIGNRVRVKVVKNKVAPPFRVAEFDVMYGEGISREGGLLDVGVAMDVVTKTGAWFTYGETRLGQGREAAKVFLRENPAVGDRDRDAGSGPGCRARRSRSRASKRPSSAGAPMTLAGGFVLAHALVAVVFVAGLIGRWIVLAAAERPGAAAEQDPGRRDAARPPAVRARRTPTTRAPARARSTTRPSSSRRRRASSRSGRARSTRSAAGCATPATGRTSSRAPSSGCSTLGYLDDAAFARAWVESRDRARPRGARALRDELRRKGVAAERRRGGARRPRGAGGRRRRRGSAGSVRRTGSGPTRDASDEDAAARLLARRGGGLLREPDPRKRRAKAYALLARNGFDPERVRGGSRRRGWPAPGARAGP